MVPKNELLRGRREINIYLYRVKYRLDTNKKSGPMVNLKHFCKTPIKIKDIQQHVSISTQYNGYQKRLVSLQRNNFTFCLCKNSGFKYGAIE